MRWILPSLFCGLLCSLALGQAGPATTAPANGETTAATPPATQPSILPHDGPVRIARWQGDRKAAISLTFDDGLMDQILYAVPALDEHHLKGTFGLNPAKIPDTREQARAQIKKEGQVPPASWEDWKEVAKSGHEIANHSMHHPNLPKTDPAKWAEEITGAHDLIEQKAGVPVVSFIYPFNATNAAVKAEVYKKHLVATGGERAGYGYGHDLAAHNKMVEGAIAGGKWMIAMVHAIKSGYAQFPDVETFRKHVAYIASRQEVAWVETLGTVAKYKKESETATLKVQAGDHQVRFTVSSDLDPHVYNVPLTLVVASGAAKVQQAQATRGNTSLPVTVRGGELLVDAAPGAEPVVVTWR